MGIPAILCAVVMGLASLTATGCFVGPSSGGVYRGPATRLPSVRILTFRGHVLQIKVMNTTGRPLYGLYVAVRGDGCDNGPYSRTWTATSPATLYAGYERIMTYTLPVYCRNVTVSAIER
jgi:hypothetical protein